MVSIVLTDSSSCLWSLLPSWLLQRPTLALPVPSWRHFGAPPAPTEVILARLGLKSCGFATEGHQKSKVSLSAHFWSRVGCETVKAASKSANWHQHQCPNAPKSQKCLPGAHRSLHVGLIFVFFVRLHGAMFQKGAERACRAPPDLKIGLK